MSIFLLGLFGGGSPLTAIRNTIIAIVVAGLLAATGYGIYTVVHNAKQVGALTEQVKNTTQKVIEANQVIEDTKVSQEITNKAEDTLNTAKVEINIKHEIKKQKVDKQIIEILADPVKTPEVKVKEVAQVQIDDLWVSYCIASGNADPSCKSPTAT